MDARNEVVAQLKKQILSFQGIGSARARPTIDLGWGAVNKAFPNYCFPTGAVHEFLSAGLPDASASAGFVAGIVSSLMQYDGACMWISSSRKIFPPALKIFGVDPDRVIFVDLKKDKEMLWAMEESLKCEGLAAVIGELKNFDFTASRRLQLAVEKSGVTGFVLRQHPKQLQTTACVSRWKITSIPSALSDGLPGVGFPRWRAELLKIRNGRPGAWDLEWSEGQFKTIPQSLPGVLHEQNKIAV